MLQQVTGEHHIDGIVCEEPKIVGPSFVELDSRLEHVGTVRIQVDADATSRAHMIQEFAVAAPQVHHRIATPDPSLKEIVDQHGPDGRSRLAVVAEAIAVELLKVGVTPHVVLVGRANVRQMVPASTAFTIQGMTSSSMTSSEVVAEKPSTSDALWTSGERSWTSCSNGGSLSYRNGVSGRILRQITSASSTTVVACGVERVKSPLSAAGCSMHVRIPRARSPP